tara:strand:- start:347 stop:1474 length:1128 start_codon:yes stop_codon:yes gene_type:complete
MVESSNFWESVEKAEVPEVSDTSVSNNKVEGELKYESRPHQEISSRRYSNRSLLLVVFCIFLLTAPFGLAGLGIIGGREDLCFGTFEYLEDEKLHCVDGSESSNLIYSSSENHVSVTYTEGYLEILRWEIIGDGGVIGFAYDDMNSDQGYTWDCLRVVTKSPFENTSMTEVTQIEASIILPQWCYETPKFPANESIEQVLPFNGSAVYLYPNGITFGSIDLLQYSEDSSRYQMISLHTYNEDGTLSEESEEDGSGIRLLAKVAAIMYYILFALVVYVFSSGRTYIEHLGTENTLTISTSWINKPRKRKTTIPLDSGSALTCYTTTSMHTDSNGHSSTSTSHHHNITHLSRASVALPDGFATDDLLRVTGLELNRQ